MADRLAELERRAPGIGADILQRAHLHRADDAAVVEGDLHVEQPLRSVRVAPRMFSSRSSISRIGNAEPSREIAGKHRVLDAALDAVAAADVHIVMHAHRRARDFSARRRSGRHNAASGSRRRRRGFRATGPSSPPRRRSRSARSTSGPISPAAKACAGWPRNPCRLRPRRMSCRAAHWSRAPRAPAGRRSSACSASSTKGSGS